MNGLFDSTLLNVLVALAVPIVWGILSAWVFDLFRARKARRDAGSHKESRS